MKLYKAWDGRVEIGIGVRYIDMVCSASMIIEVDGDLDNPYIFPIVDDFEE